MMQQEFGRRARQHKIERRCVARAIYVKFVQLRECRRISVPVVLVFVDVVS